MKLLIAAGIYPPEIGGPTTFVPLVAEGLRQRGHSVLVVTYGDKQTRRDPWIVNVVSRSGGPVTRYLRYALALRKQIRLERPDLLFAQGPVSEGVPATIVAKLTGIPLITKVVGDYAWEQHEQRTDKPELLDEFLSHRHSGWIGLLERLERWTVKSSRRVITPGHYLKTVVERWGKSSKEIDVIHNVVEPLPKPSGEANAFRRDLGLEEGDIVLFTIGRCVPWKRWDFLMSLVAKLPSRYHLVCAGDGVMLTAWKQQVIDLGIAKRVHFVGRQSRQGIANLFSVADQFLLASLYEGYPHVIVEAVSVGVPSLVTNMCGNAEMSTLFPDQVVSLPPDAIERWLTEIQRPRSPHALKPTPPDQMIQAYESLLKTLL